jgi:hypothetical protein
MRNLSIMSRNLHIPRILGLLASTCFFFFASSAAQAGQAFFIVMLAFQNVPNNPRSTHSFASYVRVTWDGCGPMEGPLSLDVKTISWLPESTILKPFAILGEPGHNFSLKDTIQIAQRDGARVSLWGPYEIQEELFNRASERVAELESGQVRYIMLDTGHRTSRACNCIHGISAIDRRTRLRIPSPEWGEDASFVILERQASWIVSRDITHDWLIGALGLQSYPIIYRDWSMPVSGTFLGPPYRALGGERNLRATYGPPPVRAHLGILPNHKPD